MAEVEVVAVSGLPVLAQPAVAVAVAVATVVAAVAVQQQQFSQAAPALATVGQPEVPLAGSLPVAVSPPW